MPGDSNVVVYNPSVAYDESEGNRRLMMAQLVSNSTKNLADTFGMLAQYQEQKAKNRGDQLMNILEHAYDGDLAAFAADSPDGLAEIENYTGMKFGRDEAGKPIVTTSPTAKARKAEATAKAAMWEDPEKADILAGIKSPNPSDHQVQLDWAKFKQADDHAYLQAETSLRTAGMAAAASRYATDKNAESDAARLGFEQRKWDEEAPNRIAHQTNEDMGVLLDFQRNQIAQFQADVDALRNLESAGADKERIKIAREELDVKREQLKLQGVEISNDNKIKRKTLALTKGKNDQELALTAARIVKLRAEVQDIQQNAALKPLFDTVKWSIENGDDDTASDYIRLISNEIFKTRPDLYKQAQEMGKSQWANMFGYVLGIGDSGAYGRAKDFEKAGGKAPMPTSGTTKSGATWRLK